MSSDCCTAGAAFKQADDAQLATLASLLEVAIQTNNEPLIEATSDAIALIQAKRSRTCSIMSAAGC